MRVTHRLPPVLIMLLIRIRQFGSFFQKIPNTSGWLWMRVMWFSLDSRGFEYFTQCGHHHEVASAKSQNRLMHKINCERVCLQAAVIIQSLYGNNKQMEGAASPFSVLLIIGCPYVHCWECEMSSESWAWRGNLKSEDGLHREEEASGLDQVKNDLHICGILNERKGKYADWNL